MKRREIERTARSRMLEIIQDCRALETKQNQRNIRCPIISYSIPQVEGVGPNYIPTMSLLAYRVIWLTEQMQRVTCNLAVLIYTYFDTAVVYLVPGTKDC